jgi:hypothetical protein
MAAEGGRSTATLGEPMRMLVLLGVALPVLAASQDLTAVDVEGITKATAEFFRGPPSYISAGSTACSLTAEDGCTLEVHVVSPGGGSIEVSKIGGLWTIGRWQREIIAFGRCTRALEKKSREDESAGRPADVAKRRAEYRSCYGPSGTVGGMRNGPIH